MNLYLLNIQKAPYITVTMLTHYKCLIFFTLESNTYKGWTVALFAYRESIIPSIGAEADVAQNFILHFTSFFSRRTIVVFF